MKFAKGDTVTLKSGGPTMTVSEPKMEFGGLVEVVWFSKGGFLRREIFDEALLATWKQSLVEGEPETAVPLVPRQV